MRTRYQVWERGRLGRLDPARIKALRAGRPRSQDASPELEWKIFGLSEPSWGYEREGLPESAT